MDILAKENLRCKRCGGYVSIKMGETNQKKWVSIMCKCETTLVYFDGYVTTKPINQYQNFEKYKSKVFKDV